MPSLFSITSFFACFVFILGPLWASPSLSFLDRQVGPVEGSDMVAIFGANLAEVQRVYFGEQSVYIDRWIGNNSLRVFTQPQEAGVVDITVHTRTGEAFTLPQAYEFAQLAPVIHGISPARGIIEGSTVVTLQGDYFSRDTVVLFGDRPGVLQFSHSRSATVVAPFQSEWGWVDVTITKGEESIVLPQAFEFHNEAPSVTSMFPLVTGPSGGGTITLSGMNFRPSDVLWVGNTPLQWHKVLSLKSHTGTFVVPPQNGTDPVPVFIDSVVGRVFAGNLHIVAQAPLLSALTFDKDAESGGAEIHLSGAGFTPDTTVTFGSHLAPILNLENPGRMRVLVPPGSGMVKVNVSNSAGSSELLNAFEFIPNYFDVHRVSRQVISSLGGGVLHIYGQGFSSNVRVLIAGLEQHLLVVQPYVIQISPTVFNFSGPALLSLEQGGVSKAFPQMVAVRGDLDQLNVYTLSPQDLTLEGGEDIFVQGLNLTYDTQLFFDNQEIPFKKFASGTSMRFLSLPWPKVGLVDAIVSNHSGYIQLENHVTFQKMAPFIQKMSPAFDNMSGGRKVAILGRHFQVSSRVWLGQTEITPVSFNNPEKLVITVPPFFAVQDLRPQIRVETSGGTAILPRAFNYQSEWKTFLGGHSPLWSDSANWLNGQLPEASDFVVISQVAGNVLIDVDIEVSGLLVPQGSSINIEQQGNASIGSLGFNLESGTYHGGLSMEVEGNLRVSGYWQPAAQVSLKGDLTLNRIVEAYHATLSLIGQYQVCQVQELHLNRLEKPNQHQDAQLSLWGTYFADHVAFAGSSIYPLKCISTVKGRHWKIKANLTHEFSNLAVRDSRNAGKTNFVGERLYDLGHNDKWTFEETILESTWIDRRGDGQIHQPENWLFGRLPSASEQVHLGSMSSSNVVVQQNTTVGALRIAPTYQGRVVVEAPAELTLSEGDFLLQGGELQVLGRLNLGGNAYFVAGNSHIASLSVQDHLIHTSGDLHIQNLTLVEGGQVEVLPSAFMGNLVVAPLAASHRVAHYGFEERMGTILGDSLGLHPAQASNSSLLVNDPQRGRSVQSRQNAPWGISIPQTPQGVAGDAFTLAFWIKLDSNDPSAVNWEQVLGSSDESNPKTGFQVQVSFNMLRLTFGDGQYTHNLRAHDLVPDTWTHLTFTFQDGWAKVYQNGQMVRSLRVENVRPSTSSNFVLMGRALVALDEVALYSRALNPKEVRKLFSPSPRSLRAPLTVQGELCIDGHLDLAGYGLSALAWQNKGCLSLVGSENIQVPSALSAGLLRYYGSGHELPDNHLCPNITLAEGHWSSSRWSVQGNLIVQASANLSLTEELSVHGDLLREGLLHVNSLRLSGRDQLLWGGANVQHLFKTATVPSTLFLQAGSNLRVAQSLNCSGQSGIALRLQSSEVGERWNLIGEPQLHVQRIQVQDSAVEGAPLDVSLHHCADAGNNNGWLLTGPVFRYIGPQAHEPNSWLGEERPGPQDLVHLDGASLSDLHLQGNAHWRGLVLHEDATASVVLDPPVNLVLGSNGILQKGGTFLGGNAQVESWGPVVLRGGHFSAPSTLSASHFEHSQGTFDPQQGSVEILGGHLATGSDTEFHNLGIASARSLLQHYKFNEIQGATVLDSVEGQRGELLRASRTLGVDQLALAFSGKSSLRTTLDLPQSYAVSLWFKAHSDVVEPATLISAGAALAQGGHSEDWVLRLSPEGKLEFKDVLHASLLSPEIYRDGQWHHALASFQSSTQRMSLHVDGVEVVWAYGNVFATPRSKMTALMGSHPQIMFMLSGDLDEFALFGASNLEELLAYDLAGLKSRVTGALRVNGTLTVQRQTLQLESQLHHIQNLQNQGTLQCAGNTPFLISANQGNLGGTVVYTGQQNGEPWPLGKSYTNLVFSGAGPFTLNADLEVAGHFALLQGDFYTAGHRLSVGGHWYNGGNFHSQNGRVIFRGDRQHLMGSTTFFDLVKESGSQLNLQSGATFAVQGLLQLGSATGRLLQVQSDEVLKNVALIANSGANLHNVSFERISSSANLSVNATVRDGGNNGNIVFSGLSSAQLNFLPSSRAFVESLTVSLSAIPENANVYYTLDGTIPSNGGGILYQGPFVVQESCTVQAVLALEGETSRVFSAHYRKISDQDIYIRKTYGFGATLFIGDVRRFSAQVWWVGHDGLPDDMGGDDLRVPELDDKIEWTTTDGRIEKVATTTSGGAAVLYAGGSNRPYAVSVAYKGYQLTGCNNKKYTAPSVPECQSGTCVWTVQSSCESNVPGSDDTCLPDPVPTCTASPIPLPTTGKQVELHVKNHSGSYHVTPFSFGHGARCSELHELKDDGNGSITILWANKSSIGRLGYKLNTSNNQYEKTTGGGSY